MIIIGITGSIGHGKTSLAKAFLRQVSPAQHTESSILISRVADELNKSFPIANPTSGDIASINAWLSGLPEILRQVAHFAGTINPIRLSAEPVVVADQDFQKLHEYLELVEKNHSLITQIITPDNKDEYRPILQWLGAYITKHVSPTLWYDELIRQAATAEASGCELFVIGGIRFPSDGQVIHQAGGLIVAIERPNITQQDAEDATEAFRSMVPVDTTVINDGALGALDHAVYTIWQDIKNDNLQTRYQVSRLAFDATQSPTIQGRDIL
jgi:hypothetical protein